MNREALSAIFTIYAAARRGKSLAPPGGNLERSAAVYLVIVGVSQPSDHGDRYPKGRLNLPTRAPPDGGSRTLRVMKRRLYHPGPATPLIPLPANFLHQRSHFSRLGRN